MSGYVPVHRKTKAQRLAQVLMGTKEQSNIQVCLTLNLILPPTVHKKSVIEPICPEDFLYVIQDIEKTVLKKSLCFLSYRAYRSFNKRDTNSTQTNTSICIPIPVFSNEINALEETEVTGRACKIP